MPDQPLGLKSTDKSHLDTIYESIRKALAIVAEQLNLKIRYVPFENWQIGTEPPWDLTPRATGILVESPREDLRFMFFSKQGISLPDLNGKIKFALDQSNFDPQEINQMIWDQSVIWPMTHFSIGYFVPKNTALDLDKINLSLPPTDFQWLGWKE